MAKKAPPPAEEPSANESTLLADAFPSNQSNEKNQKVPLLNMGEIHAELGEGDRLNSENSSSRKKKKKKKKKRNYEMAPEQEINPEPPKEKMQKDQQQKVMQADDGFGLSKDIFNDVGGQVPNPDQIEFTMLDNQKGGAYDSQNRQLLMDENQIVLDFADGPNDLEAGPSDPNQKPIKFKKIIKIMAENMQLMDHYIQIALSEDAQRAQKEQSNLSLFQKIFSCLNSRASLNSP